MKRSSSTLLFICIFWAFLACFVSEAVADSVHLLDFSGISLTDAAGNPANDFAPGNAVTIEAAFTLTRPGIAWLRGTVAGENWSEKLPLKVRIGLKGNYRATWTITVPLIANGLAQAEITLVNPFQERIIQSAFFTVIPVQKEYAGADACRLCHPGVYAAWRETLHYPLIGCEVCHGPGSKHILTQSPKLIVINNSSQLCGGCHSHNDGTVIEAQNGFITYQQQYNEWLGSKHAQANISCVTCHNPHYSISTERASAIKVTCMTCHLTKQVGLTMEGLVDCEQCHMPLAVLKSISAGSGLYRTGDKRTHIVRIKTEANPQDMFLPGWTALRKDMQGAFITDNFACLGCHNGEIARFETFEDVRKTSTLIH